MDERKAYLARFQPGTVERDLAVMMDHVGLSGVDPQELGHNHPDQYSEQRLQQILRDMGFTRRRPKRDKTDKASYESDAPQSAHELTEKIQTLSDEAADPHSSVTAGQAALAKARALEAFMDERDLTQSAAARHLGYTAGYMQSYLRLLRLPDEVLAELEAGRLTLGHAKVLVSMRDPAAISPRATRTWPARSLLSC